MNLFVDTWAWLVLRDKRESRHQEVEVFYRDFRGERGISYTTDYVLDETFTLLFLRLPFDQAKASMEYLNEAIERGYLRLEYITPGRFERAKELRLKFRDKPRISFTDLTSMIVTEELGIEEILTEDEHFTHVGMGLRRVP